MELSSIMRQVFNDMEDRPRALTHPVDLLLREIPGVGVGGHDCHREADRKLTTETAPQQITSSPAVGFAQKPPQ